MQLVTAAQMREIDRRTIEGGLVPGPELMERAGRGVFEIIRRRFDGRLKGRHVLVVCGKGNNGGDGFVIARHLLAHGAEARVFVLAADRQLSPDARVALQKLIPLQPVLSKFDEAGAMADFLARLADADLVVDALFGTGIRGGLREPASEIVRAVNTRARRVLSVDVPSGLSGDLDDEPRETVRAQLTATIGLPKVGLYHYPGRAAAGEVLTVDIGYPPEVVAAVVPDRILVDREDAAALQPAFDPAGHKYRRGSLLLVAGSRRYGGAALLATGAALRSGAGMVHVAAPASLAPLLQTRWPAAIALALPETGAGWIAPEARPLLDEAAASVDAVALGPGLGREEGALALVRDWLAGLALPALIDADGFIAFREDLGALAAHPATRVLTPHSGELGALLGRPAREVDAERDRAIVDALRPNIVLLHKGAPTLVAGPDGARRTIAGGHAAMARGGMGDVLTGLVGGVLAQAPDRPLEMTLLGAWLHAEAGRRAGLALGRALQAADLIDWLPVAWRHLAEADPDRGLWR